MKKLLIICFVLLATILHTSLSYSQSNNSLDQGFNLTIQNVVMSSDKTMEFDLYLKSTDKQTPFELALFQACILINPAFYEGGEITVSLVEGLSELNENQKPQAIIFSKETNSIKLPSRTLKPAPQNAPAEKTRGTIISSKNKGSLLCRIKISNTIAFTKAPAQLSFNFTKHPYPTMVSQYKNGLNTPLICNEKNCFNK